MALSHLSAPSRASSRVPAGTPRSGVDHVNIRHERHFTVIGNHLIQHRELSLTAIALGAYIQSLPTGARVGIKTLRERFPEGEVRISGALRELEEYGYLERSRVRLASGQVVTRTVSYNHPSAKVISGTGAGSAARAADSERSEPPDLWPEHDPDPDSDPAYVFPPEPEPEPDQEYEPEREPEPDSDPEHGPEPDPEPDSGAEPGSVQPSEPSEPSEPSVGPRREALVLLARLREDDPRLLLADRDVRKLAPGVSGWLERGADPAAVRLVLASGLPDDLRHPAALLAHRLKAWLPPHLPAAAPVRPGRRPDPMQNCDGCDRGFRAPRPGTRCRDCPPAP